MDKGKQLALQLLSPTVLTLRGDWETCERLFKGWSDRSGTRGDSLFFPDIQARKACLMDSTL